ncbi:hypothetical protein KC335_g173 [Hortaea werneckii]|nr:hypothetical protein KC335_g173 [Hortaea werneckii]
MRSALPLLLPAGRPLPRRLGMLVIVGGASSSSSSSSSSWVAPPTSGICPSPSPSASPSPSPSTIDSSSCSSCNCGVGDRALTGPLERLPPNLLPVSFNVSRVQSMRQASGVVVAIIRIADGNFWALRLGDAFACTHHKPFPIWKEQPQKSYRSTVVNYFTSTVSYTQNDLIQITEWMFHYPVTVEELSSSLLRLVVLYFEMKSSRLTEPPHIRRLPVKAALPCKTRQLSNTVRTSAIPISLQLKPILVPHVAQDLVELRGRIVPMLQVLKGRGNTAAGWIFTPSFPLACACTPVVLKISYARGSCRYSRSAAAKPSTRLDSPPEPPVLSVCGSRASAV